MAGPHNNFSGGFPNNSQQNSMRNQYLPGPQLAGMLSPQQPQTYGGSMQQVPQQSLLAQQQNQHLIQQQLQQQQQMAQQQLAQQQLQQQQQVVQQQQQQHQNQMQQNVVPNVVNQQQPPPIQAGAQAPGSQPTPNKEFNTASLCRFGQETVQDIVSRTQEVFQTLKAIQPPNGTAQGANASNEKKVKVQEQLRTIKLLFKRLRLIYEKCNENCQGMEYTHIESLIPLKEDWDMKSDEKKTSEAYRLACEENKEIMEQVVLKNKHLKEIIDHSRRIIWEINTMLTMRRS